MKIPSPNSVNCYLVGKEGIKCICTLYSCCGAFSNLPEIMIEAKHCGLCKFPKRDLEIGLTCGLTNKKPDFKTSCPDIKFSNSFKEYLPELLNKIKTTKKRKTYVYLKFVIWAAIGLTILVGNRTRFIETDLINFTYSNYLEVMGTFLIFLIGIIFISRGFQIFSAYCKKLKNLEMEKSEIEMVLHNYNLDIETILNQN